jgi:hypothetical protein
VEPSNNGHITGRSRPAVRAVPPDEPQAPIQREEACYH